MALKDFAKQEVCDPSFCIVTNYDGSTGTPFDAAFDFEKDLVYKKNGVKITFNERIQDYAWIEVELVNPNLTTLVATIEGRKDQLGQTPQNDLGACTLYVGRIVVFRIPDIGSVDQIKIFSGGMLDTDVVSIRSIRVVQNNAAMAKSVAANVGPSVPLAGLGFNYDAAKAEYSKVMLVGDPVDFSLLATLIGDDNDYAVMEVDTDGVIAIGCNFDGVSHSVSAKSVKYYIPDDSQNVFPLAVDLLVAVFPTTVRIRFRYGNFATALTAFGSGIASGSQPPAVVPATSNILNSDNTWNGMNRFLGGMQFGNLTGYMKTAVGIVSVTVTIPVADITGLGTMAIQNAAAVAITGGSVTGLTALTCNSLGSVGANSLSFLANAVKQVEVQQQAGAVNYVTLKGAATTFAPVVGVDGTDPNITLNLQAKGSGVIQFTAGGAIQFQITNISGATNFWSIEGGVSGPPIFRPIGADTNISPQFVSKGNGNVDFLTSGAGSVRFFTAGASLQFFVSHTASAVNQWNLSGSATTNRVTASAVGSDAAVGMLFSAKGASDIIFSVNGATQVQVGNGAGATRFLTFVGSAAGNPTIGVSGGKLAVSAALVLSQAVLLETSVNLTNNAGAGAGTITNAPAAGNPTKWIPINDNGTTRNIPAW